MADKIEIQSKNSNGRMMPNSSTNPLYIKIIGENTQGGTTSRSLSPEQEQLLSSLSEKIKEVEKINKKQAIFSGKKIAIMGDSISTASNITSGNSSFYNDSKTSFGINTPADQWHGQLASLIDAEVIANDAWSGSRVSGTNSSALCQARATRLPTDVNIIFIFIGINDLAGNVPLGTLTPDKAENTLNPNEITDAYCLALEKIMKRHHGARIICLTPLRQYKSATTWKNTNNVSIEEFGKRVEEICSHYGIECINMGGIGFTKHNYRMYLPDGLHPNKLGMSKIAEYIYGKLL